MPALLQHSAGSEKTGLILYYLGSGKPGLGKFSLAPRAICFGKESWVKRYAVQFDRLCEVPPRTLAQHRVLNKTHLCFIRCIVNSSMPCSEEGQSQMSDSDLGFMCFFFPENKC